jgi:hypothetical protein
MTEALCRGIARDAGAQGDADAGGSRSARGDCAEQVPA